MGESLPMNGRDEIGWNKFKLLHGSFSVVWGLALSCAPLTSTHQREVMPAGSSFLVDALAHMKPIPLCVEMSACSCVGMHTGRSGSNLSGHCLTVTHLVFKTGSLTGLKLAK